MGKGEGYSQLGSQNANFTALGLPFNFLGFNRGKEFWGQRGTQILAKTLSKFKGGILLGNPQLVQGRFGRVYSQNEREELKGGGQKEGWRHNFSQLWYFRKFSPSLRQKTGIRVPHLHFRDFSDSFHLGGDYFLIP